ncbi:MAG: hypothetical protein ACRC7P_09290 [Enterovibrio sp.]
MFLDADDFCAVVLARFPRFVIQPHVGFACIRSALTSFACLIVHQTSGNKLRLKMCHAQFNLPVTTKEEGELRRWQ